MVRARVGHRVDDTVMDFVAYAVVSLFATATLYPFVNVVVVSISEHSAYLRNPLMVIPSGFNFDAYRVVLRNPLFRSGYVNTVSVTLAGVIIGVGLTVLTAYPLSRKELRAKRFFMTAIVVTMLFNGGIIPNFYLIRSLGLIDTLWALILPPTLTAFNTILMRNFFMQIPDSIEESARIDGASDFCVLTRIVVPLSKPIIATIGLFLAVMYWNNFFLAVVYIRSQSKWTLQLLLREIIYSARALYDSGSAAETGPGGLNIQYPTTLQYAAIVTTILPILLVYPFLQRYFVKGIMLGAVKG